jgi:AcrR family transcriptional regulator
MTSAEVPAQGTSSRQVAFMARQREKLLEGGAQVLTNYGFNASIDEIVKVTSVSPTTLYRYFTNKENFLMESANRLYKIWAAQAVPAAAESGDPIAAFVLPQRMLLRIKSTHPQFAQILGHADFNIGKVFNPIGGDFFDHYLRLVEAGHVKDDQPKTRCSLFLVGLLQLTSDSIRHLPPEEIDPAHEVLLLLLGFSKKQIKLVMKYPIPQL